MSADAARLNVLVLGVGGNVSQGILKALKLSTLNCRVVGACISPHSMGLYCVDKAYISPLATDPRFVDWLIDVCRSEHIHALLSGVEPVLAAVASAGERIRAEAGTVPIVSRPERLAIADDKLATCRWLREHGFAYPRYADAEDAGAVHSLVEECGFPLIAKPRRGKGAHNVYKLSDAADLRGILNRHGYILQEYLGSPDEEYTAACFSDSGYAVRGAIVMRRDLAEGTTVRAEAGAFPEVRAEAIRIAEAFQPMGPCNIQMRLHRGRPVCFEINARFSGTTPIRARFGFNDVDATLRHFVLGEPSKELPYITRGVCVRYWNELYLDPDAATGFAETDSANACPSEARLYIEDYGKPA